METTSYTMTVTEDQLDEAARTLGLRLDILLARQEIRGGLMSRDTVDHRVTTLATTYGATRAEIRRRIGALL